MDRLPRANDNADRDALGPRDWPIHWEPEQLEGGRWCAALYDYETRWKVPWGRAILQWDTRELALRHANSLNRICDRPIAK